MFGRGNSVDIKKSIQKLLDRKKDAQSRLKHLKIILTGADETEVKDLFFAHYELIFKIVHEGLSAVEISASKNPTSSSTREEIDSFLFLLEKILVSRPDNLGRKWQLHSLTRIFLKLLHPLNAISIRREGIRLFLLWYQCLASNSPPHVNSIYSSLVEIPGHPVTWPPPPDPDDPSPPLDLSPLLREDRYKNDIPSPALEWVLEGTFSEGSKVGWAGGYAPWLSATSFLFSQLKDVYLTRVFRGWDGEDIYGSGVRRPGPILKTQVESPEMLQLQVCVIKWMVNYCASVTRPPNSGPETENFGVVREVLFGSRENINAIHIIFRHALSLPFTHSLPIRRVLSLYKEWIQSPPSSLPSFMRDISTPPSPHVGSEGGVKMRRDRNDNNGEILSFSCSSKVRVGLQPCLRYFFLNSAAVFNEGEGGTDLGLIEEQVDICKRVLNIYRYAVMNTRMEGKSWEQLLLVMLSTTSMVLNKNTDSRTGLGPKLSPALFQTLIVSWVKSSLNVFIPPPLWDELTSTLSALTHWDDLVKEWGRTMDTLTRVLVRWVYGLDVGKLPLETLREAKRGERVRVLREIGGGGRGVVATQGGLSLTNTCGVSKGDGRVRSNSVGEKRSGSVSSPTSLTPLHSPLKRSLSDSNICHHKGGGEGIRRTQLFHSAQSIFKETSSVGGGGGGGGEWGESSPPPSSIGLISSGPEGGGVCGVIEGGSVSGWTPAVGAILWRRMLGILGNPNEFKSEKGVALYYNILSDIWSVLERVRLNLSLLSSLSHTGPELVPPLLLPAALCFQTSSLPPSFSESQSRSLSLLNRLTLSNSDEVFSRTYLTLYIHTALKALSSPPPLSSSFISSFSLRQLLPGCSLMFSALVGGWGGGGGGNSVGGGGGVNVGGGGGGLLVLGATWSGRLQTLKAGTLELVDITPESFSPLMRELLKIGAEFGPAAAALTPHLTQKLRNSRLKTHKKLKNSPLNNIKKEENLGSFDEIFELHLESIKNLSGRANGVLSSEFLSLMAEYAGELNEVIAKKIIDGIRTSLRNEMSLKLGKSSPLNLKDTPNRVHLSLLHTIGKWGMKIPYFTPSHSSLQQMLISSFSACNLNHFNREKESSVLLCAKSIISHLLTQLNHFPLSAQGALCSSIVSETTDIPHLNLNETIGNESSSNWSIFSYGTHTLYSLIQLPHSYSSDDPSDDSICQNSQNFIKFSPYSVRLLLRDQNGKSCWDATPLEPFLPQNNPIISSNQSQSLNFGHFEPSYGQNIAHFGPNVSHGHEYDFETQFSNPSNNFSYFDLDGTNPYEFEAPFNPIEIEAPFNLHQFEALLNPSSQKDPFYLNNSRDLYDPHDLIGQYDPKVQYGLNEPKVQRGHYDTNDPKGQRGHNDPNEVKGQNEVKGSLSGLLEYLTLTSPELLEASVSSLNGVRRSLLLSREEEEEVVGNLLSSKRDEREFLRRSWRDPVDRPESSRPHNLWNVSSGEGCGLRRRLVSQFGFLSWEDRTRIHLLVGDSKNNTKNNNSKLERELKHLDGRGSRETHKIAVFYVGAGQESREEILGNTGGSQGYEDFVSALGWEVELETHEGFMGGLPRNKSSGETAPYYGDSLTEVIFHVSTRLPSHSEESLFEKTRHLGNDEVHIVWSEHSRDYRRDIIPTDFCDVLIVIYPLPYSLFRIQIVKKEEVPSFGPLSTDSLVDAYNLGPLVRCTAINASRARRHALQYFEPYFQERTNALNSLLTPQPHSSSSFENYLLHLHSPPQNSEKGREFGRTHSHPEGSRFDS